MGDKGEGGVKNLKQWVTSLIDSPKRKKISSRITSICHDSGNRSRYLLDEIVIKLGP